VCLSVYPLIFRFLCDPSHIQGKYAISSSQNFLYYKFLQHFKLIKLMMVAWEGNVAMNNTDKILVETSNGKKPVGRPGVGGITILSRIRDVRD
jgi:hypothetical protein